MNLKLLSDEALLSETKSAVLRERENTLGVLHRIREVERRRIFAGLNYGSLFAYCVGELGYDPSSAMRRIDAMRLLNDLPELEQKVQDGSLRLTQLARAQSFFEKEEFDTAKKQETMKALEGLSVTAAEKKLLSLSDQPEAHLHEKVKPVTPTLSEVKFYANDELLGDLEKLKGLLAHSHPEMSLAELVSYLAKLGLKQHDPSQQQVRERKSVSSLKNESARQSSKPLERVLWKRAEGRCEWVDPKTGRRCASIYRIQKDHRIPWAVGGKTNFENMRLLCRQYNLFEAERWFGRRKKE